MSKLDYSRFVIWDAMDIPESLFEYFMKLQLSRNLTARVSLWSRENFLRQLQENPCFAAFWELIQRTRPERSEYFASLIDNTKQFEPYWIGREYHWHVFGHKFREIGEIERARLETEFHGIRRKAYEAALQGEAMRRNCPVSEVRPSSLLLPLRPPALYGESELAMLPDSVFMKIMIKLDTLDLFRATLVCRRWKNVILNNSRDIKRVEHAKTTHLITFFTQMNPEEAFGGSLKNYDIVRNGLIHWSSRIAANLETLILGNMSSYSILVALLQSFPRLKNLQI